jgi:hypothetical protein
MDIAQHSQFIFFVCCVPPRYTLPHTCFICGLWEIEQSHFNTICDAHNATDTPLKMVKQQQLRISRQISRVQNYPTGAHSYAINAGARRQLMMGQYIIDHGPFVLQTLMLQTMENQEELVEIRTGVQTVITDALDTTALLDNKIEACDRLRALIVDMDHVIDTTFDMAQMMDTTSLPRSLTATPSAPQPPSAPPSPAAQWPPAGQSPAPAGQSPEPDGPPDGPPAVNN